MKKSYVVYQSAAGEINWCVGFRGKEEERIKPFGAKLLEIRETQKEAMIATVRIRKEQGVEERAGQPGRERKVG